MPVEKSSDSLKTCPACGKDTRRPDTISWIDADSPLATLPLSSLHIPACQVVAINSQAGRHYYQLGEDQ